MEKGGVVSKENNYILSSRRNDKQECLSSHGDKGKLMRAMCAAGSRGGKGHGYFRRHASYRREGLASSKNLVDATVCREARSPKDRVAGSGHDQSTLNTHMNVS